MPAIGNHVITASITGATRYAICFHFGYIAALILMDYKQPNLLDAGTGVEPDVYRL